MCVGFFSIKDDISFFKNNFIKILTIYNNNKFIIKYIVYICVVNNYFK